MAKKGTGNAAVAEAPAPATPAPATEAKQPEPNYTLVYRRDHPQNRSSYGITGVPGIVVFDKSLFADGNPPASIILDVPLAQPQADKKTQREEEKQRRAQEKADKATAKAQAAAAKLAERQQKAQEALERAKAKLAEAAGKTTANVDELSDEPEDGVEDDEETEDVE